MDTTILLVAGFIVGVMNSIAGGGMLLGFPVMLALGIPPLVANATSNIVVLPGQISSALGYRKYLRQIPRQYLLLAVPCITGAAIGATILRNTSSESFTELIPLLIVFAVALFAFQPFLHSHIHHHIHGPTEHRRRLQPLLLVALAVIPLSIYGGYFGAGFGFVMLAFLGFTSMHEIHQMNALKNIMAICLASASIVCLFSANLIDWKHGLPMAVGCTIGGYSGARIAQRVSSHSIRVVVIIIGILTAAYLVFTTYGIL